MTPRAESYTPAEVLLEEGFSRLDTIYVATSRGPCGGVNDSLEMLDRTIELTGELSPQTPIFCLHQIIHNAPVLEHYREKGILFTENLDDVQPGSVCLINAHGQPDQIFQALEERGCFIVDTTCPFVKAIHNKVARDTAAGDHIVLLGEPSHAEAIGIASHTREGNITIITSPEEAETVNLPYPNLSLHTQTTTAGFEAEAAEAILRRRFPQLATTPRGDRCTAVRVRQAGVLDFRGRADMIIIVGSPTSKNTRNMAKVGESERIPTQRVDFPHEIDPSFLATHKPQNIGLSSGASVLDRQFQDVLMWLTQRAQKYGRTPNVVTLPSTGNEHAHLQNLKPVFDKLERWLNNKSRQTAN